MTLAQRRALIRASQFPYNLIGRYIEDDFYHTWQLSDIDDTGEFWVLLTRLDQSESIWITLEIIEQYL